MPDQGLYLSKHGWRATFEKLREADEQRPLAPAELQRLAEAAYLLGRDEEAAEVWARAHQQWLAGEKLLPAARCAFWLGWSLFYKDQTAQASGWFGRRPGTVPGALGRDHRWHGPA